MPSFTLADLRTGVYRHIDNNSLFYPAADVDQHIREAAATLQLFTGYLQGSATVSGGTVADRMFYDVPQTILYPMAVYVDDKQLDKASLRQLGMKSRNWRDHTTSNFGRISAWVPVGIDKFALYPRDAVGSRDLVVEGVLAPPTLDSDDDVVQVQDSFAQCIEHMAAHTLQLKEGGKIFADSSALYQEFLEQMKELKRFRREVNPVYWFEAQSEKVA